MPAEQEIRAALGELAQPAVLLIGRWDRGAEKARSDVRAILDANPDHTRLLEALRAWCAVGADWDSDDYGAGQESVYSDVAELISATPDPRLIADLLAQRAALAE